MHYSGFQAVASAVFNRSSRRRTPNARKRTRNKIAIAHFPKTISLCPIKGVKGRFLFRAHVQFSINSPAFFYKPSYRKIGLYERCAPNLPLRFTTLSMFLRPPWARQIVLECTPAAPRAACAPRAPLLPAAPPPPPGVGRLACTRWSDGEGQCGRSGSGRRAGRFHAKRKTRIFQRNLGE